MKNLFSELRIALMVTLLLAIIVSGVYPIVVWGISQILFPHQANGSLILKDGRIVGSELLAQNFTDPKYFHPRPSAAGDIGYDGTSSGGSNLGPISKKLIDSVEGRVAAYRTENGLAPSASVPADAVTTSASGLDPHISLKNALVQAVRVARARGISEDFVKRKLESFTEGRWLGVVGEDRVNVLKLNISLDSDR
jgi:potassium-transporting ATPase KdpC subunit